RLRVVFAHCAFVYFFTAPSPTGSYPLSLHDALPISIGQADGLHGHGVTGVGEVDDGVGVLLDGSVELPLLRQEAGEGVPGNDPRSEEHTSELQSRENLVCRLLLEKKKENSKKAMT